MKLPYRLSFSIVLCVMLFAGCETFEVARPGGDFVRSTNFSSLETFSYEHTMVSGMVRRQSSQEMVMKDLSESVLVEELTGRGFEVLEQDADFFVVSKWRKEINMNAAQAVRFSLIVECYESATGAVFWRAELPYIFNGIEWSEARISQALRQAIENFPDRIEKDPNLPDLE